LLGHMGHVVKNVLRSLFGAPIVGRPPADLEHEALLISRMTAKFALTCDLAMGLLGGELKRMELLSQRLGDVLSHLYLASTSIWRYEVDNDVGMLPFARAAIRSHLYQARCSLRELYANLPLGPRRLLGWLLLRGIAFSRVLHLAPLRDQQVLHLAELLRTDPRVLARLAPDVSRPKSGGLLDLMQALGLAEEIGAEEVIALQRALRREHDIERAAATSSDPAALAYLRAADRVIQVDAFAPEEIIARSAAPDAAPGNGAAVVRRVIVERTAKVPAIPESAIAEQLLSPASEALTE